ncbi:MAG: TonB-dependent receptor [Bacteroidota bacterium]
MQRYLRLMLLCGIGMMILVSLSAQNKLVQGTVLDGDTDEPLLFATVETISGSDQVIGTTTDDNGFFRLEVPPKAVLLVSYIGYKPVEIRVRDVEEAVVIRMEAEILYADLPIAMVRAKLHYDDNYGPTVKTLGEERLLTEDAINISRAFDGLPGVQIQQGALNTQRLSLRGIGARTPFATDQVRLYWNDIPLTNGAGESVLEDIETGFLRKAYVQTGPGPAALGANLGGSIQLVSKEWDAPNWGLSGGLSVGDFGRNREWVNLHNKKGRWQQDVSLVRSASDGYRDNNDYERLSGTVLGRFGAPTSETYYLVHLRQLQAEIPSSLNINDFNEKPEAAAFNWASVNGREDQLTYLAGLQHSQLIRNTVQGSISNRSSVFVGRRTNDEVRPFNIQNEDSYQYGLRTTFTFEKTGTLRRSLKAGAELFVESYDQTTFEVLEGGAQGDELGTSTETRFYYFAFANWSAQWSKRWQTVVELNMRQTQFNWQTVNIDEDFNFSPFLLTAVSVYYSNPNQLWRWHARLNRGISQPDPSSSIENSFLNGGPLSPAFGWNRETGLTVQVDNFRFLVTGFQMDLEDALVQRGDQFGRILFINGGSARHQGIEAQLGYGWPYNNGRVVLESSYTFADYRFRDFVDDGEDFSGNDIPGSPKHRWRNQLSWEHHWFRSALTVDMAGQQWVDDANTTTADGYTVVHLRVGAQLINIRRGLRVYAGVNNIFDTLYASMVQVNAGGFGGNLPRYFYPGLPRYVYFGVDYGL